MDAEHRRQAIGALLRGERVAVFLESWESAKDEVRAMAADLPDGPAFRVSFAAGRMSIVVAGELVGGSIRFYSEHGKGYRGWSCDRLFLSAGASPELEAAVAPMVQTSRVGEVVRY